MYYKLFNKYYNISLGYGLIHSIYHVINYKPTDNKQKLYFDDTVSIIYYTAASPFKFPLYLYEDIRNTEIYLRKLNEGDYSKTYIKTINDF